MPKEIELQKQIRNYINLSGGFCWRNNVGNFPIKAKNGKERWFKAGVKGCSDIIGLTRNGTFLAIECKTRGKTRSRDGRPSPAQLNFIDEVNRRGGIGMVVWSLDEVIEKLKG